MDEQYIVTNSNAIAKVIEGMCPACNGDLSDIFLEDDLNLHEGIEPAMHREIEVHVAHMAVCTVCGQVTLDATKIALIFLHEEIGDANFFGIIAHKDEQAKHLVNNYVQDSIPRIQALHRDLLLPIASGALKTNIARVCPKYSDFQSGRLKA